MNVFVAIVSISTLFVLLNIFSFAVEGELGLAATQLSTTIDDTQTSITVVTTDGFLNVDYVIVGTENMCYTSKTATTFDGITRGCNNTEAQAFVAGTRVFNEPTGMLNSMVGFNVAEAMSTAGPIRVPFMLATTIPRAFAKMVMWDYSYLEGNLWTLPLPMVKMIILYPISAAFMIGLAVMLINVFMGVARLFT